MNTTCNDTTTPVDLSPGEKPYPHYQGENYRVEDSIAFQMRMIVNTLSTLADQRMAKHGLTEAQWKPLIMIQQGQCKTAVELARFSCSDTGSMTRLLDRIEAKGLLQRVRSQEDRRVVNLELTEDGQAAMEVVPYELADILNETLRGFTAEEVSLLKSFISRALHNVRQLRGLESG